MLARAFQEDPVNRYVFADAQQRAARFPAVFVPFIRYGLRAGVALTTEASDCVAIWLPPEHREMRPQLVIESGLNSLPSVMGAEAADRLIGFIRHLEAIRRQEIPGPHWYLMLLGVESPVRRCGIGSALMRAILDRADGEGHACYLETAQPANLHFYQSHGFASLGERVEPRSGLRFWPFKRSPNYSR